MESIDKAIHGMESKSSGCNEGKGNELFAGEPLAASRNWTRKSITTSRIRTAMRSHSSLDCHSGTDLR